MTENPAQTDGSKLLWKIRAAILFFIVMLVLSGLTAFPAETLLGWLLRFRSVFPESLASFLEKVHGSLHETNLKYPFLAYGYDWLAFAHLVIAMAFIGPWRDPVRNIWVVEWAMLACAAVIPLAMICGPIREIPFFWRLIDCSFGVVGVIPLFVVWRWIRRLEALKKG